MEENIYFYESEYEQVKTQKKHVLNVYLLVLGVFLIFMFGMLIWAHLMPYNSPVISVIKFILYSVAFFMSLFSFLYLKIKFRRVRKYLSLLETLITGKRSEYSGKFIRYDETLQENAGVDFKAIYFTEDNKYKKEFFERKVLVFYEKPFPEFIEDKEYVFVTQSNVLISYKLKEDN